MNGKTCTFFGHRNTPAGIRSKLHDTLVELIEHDGADTFSVGNQGDFDSMVHKELKALSRVYPHIRYSVVLAYMPEKRSEYDITDYTDTVFPEGLETVPRKFAVDRRNNMMLDWSDIVVTYITRSGGGAAKFRELAEKKGKVVINLAQQK